MGLPLATTSDLEDMWRPLLPSEVARARNLIDKASGLLRQSTPAVPSLDDRIALYASDSNNIQALDPTVVATVVATMVKRFISNVEGVTSTTETVGPFSQAKSFALRGDKDVRGELQVTDSDLKALRPYAPKNKLGSIKVKAALAPWPFGRIGSPPYGVIDSLWLDFNGPDVVEMPVPIYAPDISQ